MPFLEFVNKLFIYIVDHTLDISRTSTSGQSLPVQSDEHHHTSVKRIKLQTNNGRAQLASTFEVQQNRYPVAQTFCTIEMKTTLCI